MFFNSNLARKLSYKLHVLNQKLSWFLYRSKNGELIYFLVLFLLFILFIVAFVVSVYYVYLNFNELINSIKNIFSSSPSVDKPIPKIEISDVNTKSVDEQNVKNLSTNSMSSKKKIIIGVTITAVIVGGVGVGIIFIPGFSELLIATVCCSINSGFGGA